MPLAFSVGFFAYHTPQLNEKQESSMSGVRLMG